MKYRALGRTGLLVSELCLGTMTFAGRGFWQAIGTVDQAGATALVDRSIAAGVNFIDTADVYSEGGSEQLLGQAIRDLKTPRENLIIATKVRGRTGPDMNAVGLSRGHIMTAVEHSLKRLRTDYIDLYQIHGFDPATPLDETLRTLDNLVQRGLVRYIGCSNLMAWHIMKALGISERERLARFETLQAYYAISSRDLERETVPLLEDQQLGLMVWSPLAGGLLTGKFQRDGATPNDSRRNTFDFPPVDKEHAFTVVDAIRPIAAAHEVSIARVALAWLLHRQTVSSVIVGAKTIEQLDDNLAASDLVLTPAELAALDAASVLRPEYPGWMVERQSSERLSAKVR